MDYPKSVPGVGLVADRFVDENPVAGTPGSLIPASWGNAVTLELLAVIQAAGLVPSEADVDQLAEAIGKIIADGLHKTQAQFDNSKKLASTEFVQRALGSFRTETAVNSSATLGAAAIGKLIVGGSGTYTTTLPPANSVPAGSCIWFLGTAGISTWLVQRQGADIIENNGGGTFFSIGVGDTAVLESNGAGTWRIVGGSLALRSAASFGSSLAANGYQKLPSGLIIQWGKNTFPSGGVVTQLNTFPIAFPNACHQVTIGGWENANNNDSPVQMRAPSATGFTAYCYNAIAGSTGYTYIAIGY